MNVLQPYAYCVCMCMCVCVCNLPFPFIITSYTEQPRTWQNAKT